MGIIIVGTNPYSLTLHQILQKEGINVIAYTTYKEFILDKEIEGLPVVAFEDIDILYKKGTYKLLNTIGYSKMNSIRSKVYFDIKEKEYPIYTFISKDAYVFSPELIGEGSIIMPMSYIGPFVKIGVCNIINPQCNLSHHIKIGDFNFIGRGTISGGSVEIGNHCFIGLHSTIKNKINIADYTLIGAGSNVLKSTDPYSVNVGNPSHKLVGKNSLETKI